MKNFNPVRGCSEFMPKEATFREQVKQLILKSYQANGYNLIDTPILENLEFLNSSEGGDNLRMMFKTVKRGDKLNLSNPNLTEADITEEGLRYDLTVPLARFYANNKDKLPLPFKAIQIGNSFRAERPQKGRFRQFIQCDIDVFGDPTINAELELLLTSLETYSSLGFKNLTLKINHREILNAIVLASGFKAEDIATVCISLDKLDKITKEDMARELEEKGFAHANINKLIKILTDVENKGVESVKKYTQNTQPVDDILFLINNLNKLTNGAFNIVFDVTIVRGQGYYTGTIYEMFTEGFSHAIGGGGRYDKMVGKLTGQNVPAVGFGLGFEPVVMLLQGLDVIKPQKQNLALIYDADDSVEDMFKAKQMLKQNYNVSLYLRQKNIKNFYDKITSVATLTTSVKDCLLGKEIKVLNKQ